DAIQMLSSAFLTPRLSRGKNSRSVKPNRRGPPASFRRSAHHEASAPTIPPAGNNCRVASAHVDRNASAGLSCEASTSNCEPRTWRRDRLLGSIGWGIRLASNEATGGHREQSWCRRSRRRGGCCQQCGRWLHPACFARCGGERTANRNFQRGL